MSRISDNRGRLGTESRPCWRLLVVDRLLREVARTMKDTPMRTGRRRSTRGSRVGNHLTKDGRERNITPASLGLQDREIG